MQVDQAAEAGTVRSEVAMTFDEAYDKIISLTEDCDVSNLYPIRVILIVLAQMIFEIGENIIACM